MGAAAAAGRVQPRRADDRAHGARGRGVGERGRPAARGARAADRSGLMRTWLFGMLGVLACAYGAAAPAAPVGDVVRHVQERFDATKDLSASVDQELVVASAGKTMHAKGTVAFKRPGKMRWNLTNGTTQVIVADGTTLWFYQPEEQQVLKAPFRAAFRSSTPVSFLTGVGRLEEDFEVSVEGEGDGVIQLGLRPRKGGGEL